jgi:peptidyl-prolyl cis-trans isomerase A (cyclophilin A)
MRRALAWGFGATRALAAALAGCVRPGGGSPPAPEAPPGAQAPSQQPVAEGNTVVVIRTNKGEIRVELLADKAPISVKNFLAYADEGFYDGTVFHRVIDGFMIQGGGFGADMRQKPTKAPIKNEADNGLKNVRGTLAMARTSQVDSATAQFFINLVDNDFLNHGERDFGYAVFARVVGGMDVVDQIAKVRTARQGPHEASPVEPVVIESVKRAE